MRHLLTTLAAICLFAAIAHAQTMKALMFNSTNGKVAAATNVVWTNAFDFLTNTVANQVRTNLGLGWSALTNTNAATSLLGYTTNGQVVANTGTNVLTFTNNVSFDGGSTINSSGIYLSTNTDTGISFVNQEIYAGGIAVIGWATNEVSFGSTNIAAATRTNLGLGLPALTNTSNVNAMRALAGSTNTNEPYSGTVSLTNTNVLTFSNGVLLKIQ